MSLPMHAFDRGLILGDSKTDGTTTPNPADTVKWYTSMMRRIKAEHYTDGNGDDTGAPVAIQSGLPGETVGSVLALIGSRVTPWSPDWVIVQLDTNDVANAVANATFQANVISLIQALQNPVTYFRQVVPRWILWVTANFIGENYPNGANAFDTVPTGIDAKAAIVAAQAIALGFTHWNPRAAVLSWETAHNPGHLGSSLLSTVFDGPTFGKHERIQGGDAMAAWMLDGVYQGAPAALPLSPLFTFFDRDGKPT